MRNVHLCVFFCAARVVLCLQICAEVGTLPASRGAFFCCCYCAGYRISLLVTGNGFSQVLRSGPRNLLVAPVVEFFVTAKGSSPPSQDALPPSGSWIARLEHYEFGQYAQHGEDGVLAALFSHIHLVDELSFWDHPGCVNRKCC